MEPILDGDHRSRWRRRKQQNVAIVSVVLIVVVTAIAAAVIVAADEPAPPTRLRTAPTPTSSATTPSTAQVVTAEALPTTTSVPPTTAAPITNPPPPRQPRPPKTTTTSTTVPQLVLVPKPTVCEPPVGGAGPAPVGQELLAVGRQDGLHEVSLDGAHDYLIPSTTGYTEGSALSPNGRYLARAVLDESHTTAGGSAPRNLVVHDILNGCRTQLSDQVVDHHVEPTWTPDSERLGFLRIPEGSRADRTGWRAASVARGGGEVSTLAASFESPVFAPDGSGRFAVPVQTGIEIHRPGQAPIAVQVQGGAEFLAWSKDGSRLVFTLSVRQGVWVVEADGTNVRALTSFDGPRRSIYWSSFSPDGTRIAYVQGCCYGQETSGRLDYDLWIVNVDGTGARQLTTSHRVADGRPVWSPSGTSIAYTDIGVAPTPTMVMVIDVAEGSAPRAVTRGGVGGWFIRR